MYNTDMDYKDAGQAEESAMSDLLLIRAAMRAAGYVVVDRDMPGIAVADEDCYSIDKHVVHVRNLADKATLWHELCHSQQPNNGRAAYYGDGVAFDAAAYWACPKEGEARVLGALACAANPVEIAAALRVVPLSAHCPAAAIAAAYSIDYMLKVVNAAAAAASEEAMVGEWVKWLCLGSLENHPERLPRRKRQAANAALAGLMGAA